MIKASIVREPNRLRLVLEDTDENETAVSPLFVRQGIKSDATPVKTKRKVLLQYK